MHTCFTPYVYCSAPSAARGTAAPVCALPESDVVLYGHTTSVIMQDVKACSLRAYHGHKAPVTAIACHPRGWSVASGDQAGRLRIWCPANETLSTEVELELGGPVASLCYDFEGKKVAVGLRAGKSVFQVLDLGLKTLTPVNAQGEVVAVACRPCRPMQAVAACADGQLVVANARYQFERTLRCAKGLRGAAYSRDGRFVYAARMDGQIEVFDAKTLEPVRTAPVARRALYGLQWLAGGALVATGADGAVYVCGVGEED